MKRLFLVLVTLACLTATFSLKAFAGVDTNYEKGLDLFGRGFYEQSLPYLNKAAIASPSDPVIHYYLATAYVHLGKHAQAKQEYFACYCLDPKAKAGEYSRVALKAYGEPIATEKKAESNVDKAVSQIRRQAKLEKENKAAIANEGALTAGRVGEEEASRIKSAAYRRISSPSYVSLGNGFLQQEDPNVVMSRAEEGMRLAKLSAKDRASEYEKWGHAQEKAMDEISSNLESQLKTSNAKGGAQLKPEGTGFYVRFYGQERNHALPNVRPAVARIAPFGVEPNSDNR